MKNLVVALLLALVFVPLAAASDQQQANLYASTNGTSAEPARGVEAIIGVPSVTTPSDGFILSNVRLENSSGNMVQIGWFKSGGGGSWGLEPCIFSGAPVEGILVEWVDSGGDYDCYFILTPSGFTWGAPTWMQVKYVGSVFGDPGTDGDFVVHFDNHTAWPIFDLDWSPSNLDAFGSVGSEWFTESDDPSFYRTSFSNLAYQPGSGSESDPFEVAEQKAFNPPPGYPFTHTFTYASGVNAGTITYGTAPPGTDYPTPLRALNTGTASSTPYNAPLPDGNTGDVYVVNVSIPGAINVYLNTPSGWTRIGSHATPSGNPSGNRIVQTFAKRSDGTETSIPLVTFNGASRSVAVDASLFTLDEVYGDGLSPITSVVYGGVTLTNSLDPPSVSPGVGTQNWYVVTASARGAGTMTQPSGYTAYYSAPISCWQQTSCAKFASANVPASSVNPGTWTGGWSDVQTNTTLVRPASG